MDQNVPTLPQAATSNNVPGALQQLLLSRITSPEQAQQLAQNRQEQLGQYQEALRSDPSPGYSALDHSLYSWIGNMGRMRPSVAAMQGIAAGGRFRGDQAGLVHQGDVGAAKVGYEDALAAEKQADSELNALKGTMGRGTSATGKFIQFADDAGNRYIMNNLTGEREVIPASKSKLWESAHKAGYDKAVNERMPNPGEYAVEFANSVIARSPGGSVTVDTTQKPTVPIGGIPGTEADTISLGKEMKQDAQNQIIEQFRKANELMQNPLTRDQGMMQMQALKQLYPAQGAQPATPELKYHNRREAKSEEGYGSAEGPALFKERENLSQLHGKNSQLVNVLSTMESAYEDPGIPEGKLGPLIQDFRTGLKGLGIEVDKSTPDAQVFDALAKKMALGMKSADGTNLLPGAMSNYEDQLLQSLGPNLAGTREGNMKLIQLLKEVAKTNIRISEEAAKLSANHDNMLTPDWYNRKDRVLREEMARLKFVSQQIMKGAK